MRKLDDRDIFSVSEINGQLSDILYQLPAVWIEGEISNLSNKGYYANFDLKDADGLISCYAKGSVLQKSPSGILQEGKKILVKAKFSLWIPRGKLTLEIQDIENFGEGELQRAFEQLKAQLQQEGIFTLEHKKALPKFPRRIGIISSRDGDALQDVRRIISARFPAVTLYLLHVNVQGIHAVGSILQAFEIFNQQNNVDVIILTRGGGSLEDLAAFNTREIALAIYHSAIPVISGVGHEKDITIADLAADMRAATPSNAAQLVVPEKNEVMEYIDNRVKLIQTHILNDVVSSRERIEVGMRTISSRVIRYRDTLERHMETAILERIISFKDHYLERKIKKEGELFVAIQKEMKMLMHKRGEKLQLLVQPLHNFRELYFDPVAKEQGTIDVLMQKAMQAYIAKKGGAWDSLQKQVRMLSPFSILKRGYSIVYTQDGMIIKEESVLEIDDVFTIQLHKGKITGKRI